MTSLSSFFNVENQQQKKVYLLLGLGFFIGVFNVTFLVHCSSSFLNLFDEKTDLPRAIIYSGLSGVILAWLFSFSQNRTSFSRLSFAIFFFILCISLLLRLGFENESYLRQITFFSFVLIGPLNAISMLVFWGMVGRLFSIKQTKRIIGSIDTGQLIGTILTSFSIPLVLKVMVDSANLLLIGSTSIFLALTIIIIISKTYAFEVRRDSEAKTKNEVSFRQFFKEKYILLIAAFIVISMIAAVFVDYSFLHVTAKNYPDPKDLAIFIARFEGTVLVFSFLVQTFVTDRLISLYGLKVTILVAPVVLLLLSFFTIVMGLSLEYGIMFNSFILFFLTVSLCKLFNTALRDSIDGPTIKLFILPVDSAIRLDVQSKIDGMIKLFASLLGGLILIIVESSSIFSITYISIFLLAIIVVWIYVAGLMHRRYKITLHETLENTKVLDEDSYKTEYSIGKLLNEQLESENIQKALHALNLIENMQPFLLDDALNRIERSKKFDTKNNGGLNYYKRESIMSDDFVNEDFDIRKAAKSKNIFDREMAAVLIQKSKERDHIYLLNELLKDESGLVVKAAIQSAKTLRDPENYSALIELLAHPPYSNAAVGCIISFGNDIIPLLDIAFQKADQKENVMYKILYIYGQIGNELAIERLWQKIGYPDVQIYTVILRAFYYLKVKAIGSQVSIIQSLLENEIKKAAWNISAMEELDNDEYNNLLKQALEEEIINNYDIIYILLSLLYDDQSIQLVRDNIESGTSEGRVFALELLDIFLAKDIKDLLFPLLDDIALDEKIKNLQVHFPREIFDSVEILKQIINRDYNYISRWTKACAMYSYGLTYKAGISDDIIANFFNPNDLIRETAAWTVVKKDKVVFKQILTRILNQKKNKNDSLLTELSMFTEMDNHRILRIEKVIFLKSISCFTNLPGVVVSELSELIEEVKIKTGEEITIAAQEEVPVIIIYKGKLLVKKDNNYVGAFQSKSVIDLYKPVNSSFDLTLIPDESAILFIIQRNNLYEFMTKNYQFTQSLIDNYTNQSEGFKWSKGDLTAV